MSKFQEFLINKIDGYLNEGKTILNIIDNIEDLFNLNNEETTNEIFNNYCIEILEYYFEEVKTPYIYYTENLKELIQDTINGFIHDYYNELISNCLDEEIEEMKFYSGNY